MADRGNKWIRRIRDAFTWARNAHWLWTLFPAGWKAYLVAALVGAVGLVGALLSRVNLAHAWLWVVAAVCIYALTWKIFHFQWQPKPQREGDSDEPCFAFEAPSEIHSYHSLDLFIRNCGRTARDINFDPLISKSGHHAIRFDRIATLSRDERHQLTFKAGSEDSWLIAGVVNHVILFFDDNPGQESTLSYVLTIRFLDGNRPVTEQHIFEGKPLSSGGVKLRIYPAIELEATSGSDYEAVRLLRNDLQTFLDELGEEPKPDYKLAHDAFNKRLEQIGRFENRLEHGFQLRFAARVQTVIHTLGEKGLLDADLDLATRKPPKDLTTLQTIRDRLGVVMSELRPRVK